MPVEVQVNADDFLRLSKALKAAGSNGKGSLRDKLHKGLRDATKPLLPKGQAALAAGLPAPLQARGAKTKQVVQVKTGRDPGVDIVVRFGKRGTGLGASNARLVNTRGLVRHPLFGNREHWFNTPVPASQGWFDETYSKAAPEIRPALDKVIEDVAEQIVRGVL